jgi:hypothetical protein
MQIKCCKYATYLLIYLNTITNRNLIMTIFKSFKYSQADNVFTIVAIDQYDTNLYKDLVAFAKQYRKVSKFDKHLLRQVSYQLHRGRTMTISL